MKSNITIYANSVKIIPYTKFIFPGGEIQVKIDTNFTENGKYQLEHIAVTANIFDSEGIIELLLVANAIKEAYGDGPLWLTLPYFPYSRQDRVCSPGEAFSFKVVHDLLLQYFDNITTYDLHNPRALLPKRYGLKSGKFDSESRIINYPASIFIRKLRLEGQYDFVVAPDKGAKERADGVAKYLNIPVITAEKVRDPNTGHITHTAIPTTSNIRYHSKFLIVDDICDGGRTFVELAKVLHERQGNELVDLPRSTIDLYVTHGIFSKGLSVFAGLINKVYTANLFPNEDPEVAKNVIVAKGE